MMTPITRTIKEDEKNKKTAKLLRRYFFITSFASLRDWREINLTFPEKGLFRLPFALLTGRHCDLFFFTPAALSSVSAAALRRPLFALLASEKSLRPIVQFIPRQSLSPRFSKLG
jgi:hypothetical protein